MNIGSALIACLSYTLITAFVYTITWGLSRHLFTKVKIYYEMILGISLGVISIFGVIILSLTMGENKNLQLTILLPMFLFWTSIFFISIYSTIGILVSNILSLFVFSTIFPQYFGKLEDMNMIILIVVGYVVPIIIYFLNAFWKKINAWSSWSLTTIACLATAMVFAFPTINEGETISYLMTILLWLGTGYFTYGYITLIDQIYIHALQLQNIVAYDDVYYLNQSSAHEQLLKFIQTNKVRSGYYVTFFISHYDMFEKKVSNNIKDIVVSSVSKQAYELFNEQFKDLVFFKPNYKTYGVFIPIENEVVFSKEKNETNIENIIKPIFSKIDNKFTVENFKITVSLKAIVSIYGLHSNNLDNLYELNNYVRNDVNLNNQDLILVDPKEVVLEKNKNKKILTLNEIVSLNHVSSIFDPIYDSTINDFEYLNINSMVEGIEMNSSLFKPKAKDINEYGLSSLLKRYTALTSIKDIHKYKITSQKVFLEYDTNYIATEEFDIKVFLAKLKMNKIKLNNLILKFNIQDEIDNREMLAKNLNALKEYGIKTAVDDFGAENCDYSLLSIYQPEFIFLQKTICKKVNIIKENEKIIKNSLNIANKIDAKLIATNIDSYMIFKTIKELGVTLFTGELIGSSGEPKLDISTELKYLLTK
ncbi:EAL domain-containing protein [Spiroplasma culicicola]|uniref:EAL domain-containing protein n=1 Tax=Spiroplasma culicicola AES-1 TaxID=1276246 RepID=W6AFG8_9MOLU|nr:EAL domain-containing protein [Spiroplasma culicicola]AHI52434.1 hypothetical protein SCULI_v1c00930 [Spiroplasma culicicola AES-1]